MPHFIKSSKKALPVIPLTNDKVAGWSKKQPKKVQAWISSTGFKAQMGDTCLISDSNGKLAKVLVGVSKDADIWDCAAW